MNKTFSIRESFRVGWQKTKAYALQFFFILVTSAAISSISDRFSKNPRGAGILPFIISILAAILLTLVQMGFLRSALKVLADGTPQFKDFSSSPLQFLKFIAAAFLYAVLVLVGGILLIVPGIIFAIRFQFYTYIILEDDCGPIEALKRSWELTRGQTGMLFLFGAARLCLVLIGFLLFLVGLFVAIPVVTIAAAFVYRKLRSPSPEPVVEAVAPAIA